MHPKRIKPQKKNKLLHLESPVLTFADMPQEMQHDAIWLNPLPASEHLHSLPWGTHPGLKHAQDQIKKGKKKKDTKQTRRLSADALPGPVTGFPAGPGAVCLVT